MDKIYIFDADGVVIEPWGFANALEQKHQISRDLTAEFFSKDFVPCLTGDADLRQMLLPHLDNWGWDDSIEALIHLWHTSENLPKEAVLSFVQSLRAKGFTCCLASNQEQERASYIKQQMGFSRLFDYLFFSCDLGSMKPEPEFYEAITTSLNCKPTDIVFWDDTAKHVAGALNAGWDAHLFESEKSLQL